MPLTLRVKKSWLCLFDMKFKIDENLPVEIAAVFQQAGHDTETVHSEGLAGVTDQLISKVCLQENRVLVTLDMGFADIRTYSPNEFPGFVVLRTKRQDKPFILEVIQKIIPALEKGDITGKLWIVEENRIRIRS